MKYILKNPLLDKIKNIQNDFIIEASAGTGKTYTIEHIVLKLIIEGSVTDLSQILLVTFTEKATGELKIRIRNKIADILENPNYDQKPAENEITNYYVINENKIKHLSDILINFDEANIYTIHALCNGLLKDYPFETNSNFKTEIADDPAILKEYFYDYLRKVYINDNNKQKLLENYLKTEEHSKLFDNVKKFYFLEGTYTPDIKYFLETIKEIYNQLSAFQIKYSESLFESMINKKIKYNGQNFNSRTKNKKLCLEKLCVWCDFITNKKSQEVITPDNIIVSFYEIVGDKLKYILELSSIKVENENGYNIVINFFQKCKQYQKSILTIKEYLTLDILNGFREYFNSKKKSSALISYNDMIKSVYDAININNSPIIEIMRQKYKFAIIDEFQDTDIYQWKIFEKVFFDSDKNYLIVIGDPKQAIYSFRGADVFTYLKARKQFETTNAHKDYLKINLYENFRSTEKIISGLNNIFNDEGNSAEKIVFQKELNNIKVNYFESAKSAEYRSINKVIDYEDKTETNPIVFITLLEENINADIIRARFKGAISNEIKNLLNNNILIENKESKELEPIKPSDIAVLAYSRKNLNEIQQSLKQKGISAAIYKQKGLFQTDEALDILFLLKAIHNPFNHSNRAKAWLTSFFDLTLKDIKNIHQDDIKEIFIQKLAGWHQISIKLDFNKLFNSIIKETKLLKRELFWGNNERVITNYEHIFELLLNKAKSNNFNLNDLINYLNEMINSEYEDENLLRLETEKSSVQLLTIHASKGLEFPVVFVYGGFNKGTQKNYIYYNEYEKKISISGNIIDDETDVLNIEDTDIEEAKRLLYVALTRAKYKLYLPFIDEKTSKINGRYSHLIRRFNNSFDELTGFVNSFQDKELYSILDVKTITEKQNYNLKSNENQYNLNIEQDLEKWISIIKDKYEEPKSIKNYIELSKKISLKSLRKDSFSSLKKKHEINFKPSDEGFKEYDETHYEITLSPDIKKDEIPGGDKTGSVVHYILEKIDFNEVNTINSYNDLIKSPYKNEYFSLINTALHIYGFSTRGSAGEVLRQNFTNHIIKTLNTKLPKTKLQLNNDFSFSEISDNDKIQELEFTFPYPLENSLKSLIGLHEKIQIGKGVINGIIDMIFIRDNKFFILDWKTNKLADYSAESVTNVVSEEYELQYKIYTLAFIYWQKISSKEDFITKFGGIIYVFTRGINDTGDGIFFKKPEWDEIKTWELEIVYDKAN